MLLHLIWAVSYFENYYIHLTVMSVKISLRETNANPCVTGKNRCGIEIVIWGGAQILNSASNKISQ